MLKIELARDEDRCECVRQIIAALWILVEKGLTVSQTLCRRTEGEQPLHPHRQDLPLKLFPLVMGSVRRVYTGAESCLASQRAFGAVKGEREGEKTVGRRLLWQCQSVKMRGERKEGTRH